MMDASGYKIGRAQREQRSTSSKWRGERTSTLSLSVLCHDWSFLPPRTESRSRNLPLWMKSAIAYAFSERVKKVSGYAKWSSRLPKHCESTAQLNSRVAAAIAGFFHPLDSLEQSPKLRPLLKVLLEGCKEVITQLATNMIVQQPDLDTLHVGDAYVNAERMAALYAAAASGDPDEKTILYTILSQMDSEAAGETVLLPAMSACPPVSTSMAAFRNAVFAVMSDLENDEAFKDLAHVLGFLQYKLHAMVTMEDAAITVMEHLSPPSHDESSAVSKHELRLRPEWDPVAFMVTLADEYGMSLRELPELAYTLTLTGSEMACYANTCQSYAEQMWPRVADAIISMLDSALAEAFKHKKVPANVIHRRHSLTAQDGEESEPRITAKIAFVQSYMELQLEGTAEDMIEVTQLMAWMTATLRLLPDERPNVIRKCSVSIVEKPTELVLRPTFSEVEVVSGPGLCWLSMMSRPVMATGFPIPDRGAEVGLEIPLQIASALIGSSHAAEYSGGVVVKGFSAMMVPEWGADDRIQWHLVSSKDQDTPLSYDEGASRCPERLKSSEADMASLLAGRAFVGWHRNVVSRLGCDPAQFDYGSVRDSHARDPNSRVLVEGLTVGFQQIAAAQVNIKFVAPQSPAFFRAQRRRYAGIVRLADNTRVLLYDTEERRAWLVPASEVILHMVQHRLAHNPAVDAHDGQPVRLDLSGSAADTLILNAGIAIEEGYTFQNMVENTWEMLEFLHSDLQTKKMPRPFSLLSTSLLGYEFRQCAEEASSFNLRQTSLASGADGWVSLVKDSGNLVLFGRGFGDLMLPRDDASSGGSGICPLWRTVPQGRDLMATSVRVLEQIYDQVPSKGSRRYLSQSKLEWHRGEAQLFEACSSPQSECSCQRAQKITSGRHASCKPPDNLISTGGVIFGDCGKLKRRQAKQKELGTPSPQPSRKELKMDEGPSPESSPRLRGIAGLRDRILHLDLSDTSFSSYSL